MSANGKRLQAVVLNSESHSSGELAGILKAPRSKVSEWLARYEAYVGRFESPTSAARQLRGVLSTRVAVLSNQHTLRSRVTATTITDGAMARNE